MIKFSGNLTVKWIGNLILKMTWLNKAAKENL